MMSTEPKPIHAKPSLYAFYFSVIKEVGLKYGYNIVLHGSLARDLDLVAIPWQEEIGDKDLMIDEIAQIIGGVVMMFDRSVDDLEGKRFTMKPFGRMAYIININRDIELLYDGFIVKEKDFSQPQYYIDLSVLPANGHIQQNSPTD